MSQSGKGIFDEMLGVLVGFIKAIEKEMPSNYISGLGFENVPCPR